jgi:transcriptional regulator with XRE-family HTH domain
MPGDKESLGEYVKNLRNSTKDTDGSVLSLRSLAERIQVSPTYLSKVERGLYPASAAVIERLAKALGVSKDELFARADKIAPDIEEGFANSEAPAMLASFMRRATALPPDKLEMANRIIGAIHETAKAEAAPINKDTTKGKDAPKDKEQ